MATRNPFKGASGRIDGDAVSRLAGSGLLLASAALHADLYATGYRTVPNIGRLFLAQSATAASAGLVLLALVFAGATAVRRAFGSFSVQQVAAGVGSLVALATVSAYAAALDLGTFGYKAVPSTAGAVSACIELAAFALLGRLACSGLRPGIPAAPARAVVASAALSLMVLAEVVAAPAPVAASPRMKPGPVVVLTSVSTSPAHDLVRFSLHEGPVVAVGRRTVPGKPAVRRPVRPVHTTHSHHSTAGHGHSQGHKA